MKKLLLIPLSLSVLLTLGACGKNSNDTSGSDVKLNDEQREEIESSVSDVDIFEIPPSSSDLSVQDELKSRKKKGTIDAKQNGDSKSLSAYLSEGTLGEESPEFSMYIINELEESEQDLGRKYSDSDGNFLLIELLPDESAEDIAPSFLNDYNYKDLVDHDFALIGPAAQFSRHVEGITEDGFVYNAYLIGNVEGVIAVTTCVSATDDESAKAEMQAAMDGMVNSLIIQ